MAKRKMGRPKLPADVRREIITLRFPKPFVKQFADLVASLEPRTSVTAVVEMLMKRFISEHENQ